MRIRYKIIEKLAMHASTGRSRKGSEDEYMLLDSRVGSTEGDDVH
jgi:hypothetical protein